MTNTNLTTATSTVIADTPMWAGVIEDSNTDWLQSPIGSNASIGAPAMMIVDLVLDQGELATVFDLADQATATKITGVDGTAVLSILGLHNLTAAARPPTAVTLTGATLTFTGGGSAGVGDGDIVRATLIYR
jgi:hypothetical protein|tara:strand:+ start:14101 stop:14496 length:396 start_codon:yes stop_codon:yes gene_type:complete